MSAQRCDDFSLTRLSRKRRLQGLLADDVEDGDGFRQSLATTTTRTKEGLPNHWGKCQPQKEFGFAIVVSLPSHYGGLSRGRSSPLGDIKAAIEDSTASSLDTALGDGQLEGEIIGMQCDNQKRQSIHAFDQEPRTLRPSNKLLHAQEGLLPTLA
ncbi:hypothetical protein PIB30_020484 [Stylosanthes scabra]|uniref:Uncharacterized protein n=1 Tax=Stylosanthes scabra TaxID=79078 RepID=A0ABU6WC51_9FABA|nr:hypothetical protein [Stylosanthes scabra]